ncbi:alkaline D-peptidase [Patulibacter medicamentivorans]|uniref:Alkaline D-peptidase n=1 Tax=Patulibacter medicamentivorans TaxID=1097667 RepID=H0E0C8_9ACTN|nr:serine hydrolase domain-containing protein [Patulibacter medicamentivorans]EHN12931.1 alkaline D-peptidase [Patulibacter medicamentivorans]
MDRHWGPRRRGTRARGGTALGRAGAIAAACAIAAAVPATADAGSCPSDSFDRGGTCTTHRAAAAEVARITRAMMAERHARAMIVRVEIGARTVVRRAFGTSMAGVPARPEMRFRPGSMTIPLLTTLALQLQDAKRLDLDAPLARWYPRYPNADRVTLRMLASSTSGYPDYAQGNQAFVTRWLGDPFRRWTDDELLRYAFAQPAACAPGACFHYAHTNFVLLGRVLERVTGRSVATMLTRRFLRPLGMRQTRISKLATVPEPALHAYVSERGVYEESTSWSPSWGLGDGLIMTTTARDMAAMIRAIGSGRLVSRTARRELVAPLSRGLEHAPPIIDYALGIVVAKGWLFQNPQFNGYHGIVARLPVRRMTIVLENTLGPLADPQSISATLFGRLTQYLTPDRGLRF